jgi:hypothetical protein
MYSQIGNSTVSSELKKNRSLGSNAVGENEKLRKFNVIYMIRHHALQESFMWTENNAL